MDTQKLAKDNLVFKCVTGSKAYGTDRPTSDVDTRGVFIAPIYVALSCCKSIEQVETPGIDETIFELKKFIKLAADANPNILDILFADKENILYIHPVFQEVLDNKHIFLSKKVRHTFSGYAMAQLHRIKGHRKWIMQPQGEVPPKLGDYCRLVLSNGQVTSDGNEIRKMSFECFLAETFGSSQFRVFKSPEFFQNKLGFFTEGEEQLRPINVHDDILRERAEYVGFLLVNIDEYKAEHTKWKQYWDWKKNRNEDRAELEEKYTFDTKHASHLVRLMKMCKEILTDGKVLIRRPDAKELLAIRNGKFKYDELIEWAENSDKELDALYEKSTLPHSPNWEKIDELYRSVLFNFWGIKI